MVIKLAGYNVETEALDSLNKDRKMVLTPEIFSAAYARISRSSKDITTLRNLAREDVEKARGSNKKIIFEMGHHSVAEHAVFNFDVIGVSRLALEEIEKFRLVSYTEKSQRYVILKGDFTVPEEINDKESRDLFKKIINLQNEFYKKSYAILKEHTFKKFPLSESSKLKKRDLENLAKEDARYILSLATQGQVGLTINARNLEHLFRRFSMNTRTEIQKIGKKMFNLVKKISPSIILFPEPSKFEKKINSSIKESFKSYSGKSEINQEPEIIQFTENSDNMILATFLCISNSLDFTESMQMIKKMTLTEKEKIFRDLFENMEFFDTPPREFEIPEVTFSALVSASNFAQLKRHRVATLISGDYDIKFGNVIPESIQDVGLEKEFSDIIKKTNSAYKKLRNRYSHAADYVLTNSHRRMVIVKMNLRELYHFSRLREDEHAQWDIRNLAQKIIEKTKKIMPLSTLLMCGKNDFFKKFEDIYGKKPECLL